MTERMDTVKRQAVFITKLFQPDIRRVRMHRFTVPLCEQISAFLPFGAKFCFLILLSSFVKAHQLTESRFDLDCADRRFVFRGIIKDAVSRSVVCRGFNRDQILIKAHLSDINQENAERFRQQMVRIRERQLERLYNKTITVKISNYGLYAAKNIKLYGRKAVGVDHDGNFILGKWEQIKSVSTLVGGTGFTASGEYVAFAFSYDVVWGTNFPFSGIFWNKVHWDGWNEIDIRLTGTCRMAGTKIYVGDELAVDESNCSAHKEWKP